MAVSVVLPVLLFAALTVVSQIVSPARGQSLLPALPSITTVSLARGDSAEMYLDPGGIGVNEFHIILSGPGADAASAVPRVTAGVAGAAPHALRQLRVSPGHFTELGVVLTPGPVGLPRGGAAPGQAPVSFRRS